jgi:hypothetical protein
MTVTISGEGLQLADIAAVARGAQVQITQDSQGHRSGHPITRRHSCSARAQ